jgi:hypothetical protein
MLRPAALAACVALTLSLGAVASPVHARSIPPVPPLSEDAECWYGELYGIESIICRETDGRLYRCLVARTQCWHALGPGPYRRLSAFGSGVSGEAASIRTRR